MSQHNIEEEDINIGEAYSKAEKLLDDNKQSIGIAIAAVVIVVLGTFYYLNMYLPPLQKNAAIDIAGAQKAFAADSFNLAMNGNTEFMGFEEVIDTYSSTEVGNTAKYYMGISLLNTGNYDEAIDFLNSYSPNDHITLATKEGAIGDCYSQLGQYDDAISAYKKAANVYINDFSTPIYLKKAGMTAEKVNDYTAAVSFYEKISADYPSSTEGRDIEKYLAHAQSLAK